MAPPSGGAIGSAGRACRALLTRRVRMQGTQAGTWGNADGQVAAMCRWPGPYVGAGEGNDASGENAPVAKVSSRPLEFVLDGTPDPGGD
jgi:hypothetical protein